MTSHPDVEALAFFAEELLEPDEERTVAAHVNTCTACAATLEELSGVSEVLATAPTPGMPQDVADLLDRTIAEAARGRAAEPDAPDTPEAAPQGATVTPLSSRRRVVKGVNMPRLMLVAAAAIVIGGGGAAVFNAVAPSNEQSVGDVAAPLEGEEEEAAPDTAQSYAPRVVRSGTVYGEPSLPDQARRTLDLSPVEGGGPAHGDAQEGDAPLTALESTPAEVETCARLLTETWGRHFSLVDDASYGEEGRRAWVLFAPQGQRYEVYVVDPRCGQGEDPERSVLARETIQAP